MSNNKVPKTPTKEAASPAKFVKPADLFKMRRRTSSNSVSSFSNQDSSTSPLKAQMRSSPLSFSPLRRVNQYVPNSSKFSSPAFHIEPQSPLKCLNNMSDPSPTKNLPTILKNPFNQPVKRKLNLGFSPRKGGANTRSPTKKTRMLEIDEDANLEPPKMKQTSSPTKKNIKDSCIRNDWTLRTKLKVSFETQCKNWNGTCASTHKRISGSFPEESPSKQNDKTISVEAIKNACIVYQHPYLAWLPLYPRAAVEFDKKKDNPLKLTPGSQVTKMMHEAWCESLNDITNLLIHGSCPYFYLCADNFNILFKKIPSSNHKRPLVQAYVSPFSCGMGIEFNKSGIEFKCPDVSNENSTTILMATGRENSQASSFGSSSQSRVTSNIDEENSQAKKQNGSKISISADSGQYSDLELDDDENEDASQFLERIYGTDTKDISKKFPYLQSKRKGFTEGDSNTQSKQSTSSKPLAITEGKINILKLISFLQTNRLYTVSNMGKFACVPPTLLSPTEFRLSTPQYPQVKLSKNMIEHTSPDEMRQKYFETPRKAIRINDDSNATKGPTFLELEGTILPNLHDELHKLLTISDNRSHTCSSTTLESSTPFQSIQYSS